MPSRLRVLSAAVMLVFALALIGILISGTNELYTDMATGAQERRVAVHGIALFKSATAAPQWTQGINTLPQQWVLEKKTDILLFKGSSDGRYGGLKNDFVNIEYCRQMLDLEQDDLQTIYNIFQASYSTNKSFSAHCDQELRQVIFICDGEKQIAWEDSFGSSSP